jgi:hypothetical protein
MGPDVAVRIKRDSRIRVYQGVEKRLAQQVRRGKIRWESRVYDQKMVIAAEF